MNAGEKVIVTVNGSKSEGIYMRPISRKNRHRIAVKKAGWTRDHWVTTSAKKISRA